MKFSDKEKMEMLEKVLTNCKQRISSGNFKVDSEEYKQCVKNEIVVARRCIIHEFKDIDRLHETRRIYDKNYEYYGKTNDAVNRAETYLKICEINELVKQSLNIIANFGEALIELLTNNNFKEHDLCQLLNINWKTFQNVKSRYMKNFGDKEHLLYRIVSVCGPEYRDRKGRMEECYDCPQYEMPVYWAISERIMQEMENNEEFKKATDKKFKELFPGLQTYRAVTDLEGNTVKVVKNTENDNNN